MAHCRESKHFPASVSLDASRSRARAYLRQAHMALSEIAFLLGYSELGAFSRAFHHWTGVSPRDYRDRLSRR